MERIDPRSPCPHPAGNPWKRLWLQARASARLPLFDPRDNADIASVEEIARTLATMPRRLRLRIEYGRRERINGRRRGCRKVVA